MASTAGIPALVRHMRSGSKAQQLRTAAALEALACQGASSSAAIVNAGGIAALVSCLQHSSSAAVSRAAALALAALGCYCPPGHGDFGLAAAAMPALVRMMAAGSPPELQQAACVALNNLGIRGELLALAAAAEAGAIPAAVQLLQSCSPVPPGVAAVVGSLTKDSAERSEAFAAAGGISASLSCLPAAGAEEQVLLLAALAHIALFSPRTSPDVMQAGGVTLLVRHLKDGRSAPRQQRAWGALLNLASCSEGAKVAILAAGVMPAAMQLLTSSQPEMQAAAAALIGNLCTIERGVQQAQQAGALSALLRILGAGERGGEALLRATQAIYNIVLCSPAAAAALIAAGALPLLAQLSHSVGSQDLRSVASVTLARLQHTAAANALPAADSVGAAAAQPPGAAPQPPTTCAAPGCTNTQGLRRCGGCRAVRYCGEACRNEHWREHKAECRRVQAAAAMAGCEGSQSTAAS